ncbi:coiled-coil domain-containing protein 97, partial [Tanacetum coccineum]
RYGSLLTLDKLKEFDMLNHRRAFMDKFMYDGKLFSEDSMRDREPYLHHDFVGKFQDQIGRRMSRPGEKWSKTLLKRVKEALLMENIWMEQQQLGVDEMDRVGNERREEQKE